MNRGLALVLGSGGVKSIAGLGVAEVLHKEGWEPDEIVGCSAGALFGAILACGHSPAKAVQLAQQVWSRDVTSQRRHGAWLDLAGSAIGHDSARAFGERFALRGDELITARLKLLFGDLRLESLALPMRVVATDAASGQSVVISTGPVWEAVRASVALPFLFAPFHIDGWALVDGSVSDPLPLGVVAPDKARVGIGFAVPLPKRVDGPTRLATRITASLTNNLMQARIAVHEGPDTVVLLPSLARRVGLFDTEAMPELVALGRQAALDALPRLQALRQRSPALELAAA